MIRKLFGKYRTWPWKELSEEHKQLNNYILEGWMVQTYGIGRCLVIRLNDKTPYDARSLKIETDFDWMILEQDV